MKEILHDPNTYYTTIIPRVLVNEVMQDSYHQQSQLTGFFLMATSLKFCRVGPEVRLVALPAGPPARKPPGQFPRRGLTEALLYISGIDP